VKADVAQIPEVAEAIAALEGISEVYSVTGQIDLIALVREAGEPFERRALSWDLNPCPSRPTYSSTPRQSGAGSSIAARASPRPSCEKWCGSILSPPNATASCRPSYKSARSEKLQPDPRRI